MSNLKKALLVSGVMLGTMALPLSALASVNANFLTLDGLANTTANIGDTVQAKVTYDITSDEDVESLSYEIVGSGIPETCVDIPDQIQSGTFHPQFEMNLDGATAGTYDVKIRLFGVNGSGSEQLCQDAHEQDNMTFTNRIAIQENGNDTGVVSGTGGGNGNSSSSNTPSWLQALIAALRPAAPAASSKCAAIAPFTSAPSNTYSALGVQLQSALLLDNPYSIPALKPGSSVPMGWRGVQTEAALSAYNATNHC